jgi:type I restriction enzyme S subunit
MRVKLIGDVCEVIAGQSPKSTFYNKDEDGLPFYQGKKEFSDKYIGKPTTWTTKVTKEAFKDDILMSVRAPVGPVNFATEHICIGRGLAAIRASNEINKEYLFYFLIHYENQIIGNIGAVFNSINKKQIESLEILLPKTIEEQTQIVTTLDKAFKQIDQAKANLEKNLNNAKELFQSKLNEVFSQRGEGWEEKTLKEVSNYFDRGKSKHRPRNDESLFGGDYPFIQTGDVRNSEKYIKLFSQTYNEKGLSQSKLWTKNTICITIAANIAETAILEFDACFPDSIIGLVIDKEQTTVEFAYYALQFLKTTLQALGKGSAQDNLNLKTFETQYFPFPTLEVQEEIVLTLNSLKNSSLKLEEHYQQKLNNLEELKKSILQKAFRGE